VTLGLPVATQILLEVGVFGVAATLVGRLGPSPLAAHEVVLNVVGTAFMIPLGISSAAAVRVGQAVGRGDPPGAARAGWTALLITVGFMLSVVLTFTLLPRTVLRLYTPDPGVIATGVTLLAVAACFQVFDGAQCVASGALRGAGETRVPMLCNLVAHWALGLPLGYALAFGLGWGLLGLWIGLGIGLCAAGAALLWAWRVKERSLRSAQ
jgi:MATE family multidrug resistance protein